MVRHTKRALIIILAIIFFILGLIGLVLPVLQGWLFFAICAVLVSIVSPRFQTWAEHHTRKFPKVHQIVVKIESYIRGIVGEI